MERQIVLGIDYGGKYTGLAVVDRRYNQVLYARTVEMRDDVADILEGRREQRGIRRTLQTKKKRLRELKNYLKSIGHDESTDQFKTVYSLCHKRGYDYVDMPKAKTQEEIEAMDDAEQKQWEKDKKEWEETQRNSRHRDEVLKDVHEAMSKGGAIDEHIKRVERIFNKQYRPKRFNNRILTKCKVEDCEANTPLRKNARDLLIENIVRFLPLEPAEKEDLKAAALDKDGRDKVKAFFRRHKIDEHLRKQIDDIAYNPKLSGRTVFCKKHILEHTEHTKEERKVFRLAPSLKTKIENVLAVIKDEVLPWYQFGKVVMETNNFDIEVKTQGKKKETSDDGQDANSDEKLGLRQRLIKETNGQCVYCGAKINESNMEIDHIFPVIAGGLNIYANMAASCKKCNGDKKGRTPQEAGKFPIPGIIDAIKKNLKPKFVRRKIGGVTRKFAVYNDLKIKILENANSHQTLDFNKYMSHASIGWRHMRDRLREETKNQDLIIDRKHGYQTAHFRKWWPDFIKKQADDKHHALDAVILASRWETDKNGSPDPLHKPVDKEGNEFDPNKHLTIETKKFKRDKGSRGSALHDRNPLSYKNDAITRRFMVTEIECGKEGAVVSDEYREKLTKAFTRFNKKKAQGNKRGECLTDEEAKLAGFWLEQNDGRKRDKVMSLKCKVKGTGEPQLVRIKNNVFKTNVHNIGVAVYSDEKGRKKAYELKNPRLLKYFVEPQPGIEGRILFTLKRGDFVKYEGEDTIYRIKKLGESPALEAVIKGDDDKIRNSAKAAKLIKISDKDIPSKFIYQKMS